MEKTCITGLDAIPQWARDCVLTLGNFDGMHLGHQRILLNCRTLADREKRKVVAITFDPLPEAVLYPNEAAPPLIYPIGHNCRLLLETGADLAVVIPTNRELLSLPPREFVDQIVMHHFAPRHIVEGANFFFGRGRTGSVVTLENLGVTRDFTVTVLDAVVLQLPEGQRRVSSTLIREMIQDGRVDDANFCLGREFSLWGKVVTGEGRGKELQFPTANLSVQGTIIPADGVYAGRASVDDLRFVAAISIGTKPTFGRAARTIEAHLLDVQGDFHDRSMSLTFVRRLRDQQKFPDSEALRAQMAKDVEDVRAIVQ
jgi:riboflavin kinase/FMN adenylyltransferase